jgi:hypothetical protein
MRSQFFPARRKRQSQQVRSNVKVVLSVLFNSVGWCIMITHHKAKPPQRNTTRGSFIAFVMLCSAHDRIFGQQNLGISMIMHPPILHI